MASKRTEFVHIVGATRGDYDDREEWIVAVYRSKPLADEHAAKAKEYATAEWEEFQKRTDDDKWIEDSPASPFDGNHNRRAGVPFYFVTTVAVSTKIPARRSRVKGKK